MIDRQRRRFLITIALLMVAGLVAFLISTRGLSNPDRHDLARPLSELATRAEIERDRERLVFSLQCLAALTSKKYKAAIDFCDLGLAQAPGDPTLLKLRGNAHFFSGRPKLALADFNRAIALTPGDADTYRLRAMAYATLRRDREAIADFDRAVAMSPGNPVALEFRGYFFETRQQYGRAIDDFVAAIQAQPNGYHAWNSLCWTLFLAKRSDKSALNACNKAIALNAAYMNSFDSRGCVFLRLRRYREALRDFDRVLAASPAFASSLFGRGVAKSYLQDMSAAADIFRARRLDPSIEARFSAYGIRVRPMTGTSGT